MYFIVILIPSSILYCIIHVVIYLYNCNVQGAINQSINPSQAKPSQAKPSQAKPSQAKPHVSKQSMTPFGALNVIYRLLFKNDSRNIKVRHPEKKYLLAKSVYIKS